MRVMVVSNIFPPHVRGGYELGIVDLARAFVSAGHEVEVVTSMAVGALRKTRPVDGLAVQDVFAPVVAYEADLAERLDHALAWRTARTEALGGVLTDTVVAFRTAIARFDPDRIWIGNPLGIGPVGILETALTAGVPTVVHLMDDIDRYLAGYGRPIPWTARVARIKRSLTAVSCASHVRDMNSVAGEYGRHHVVPNGIDFSAVTRHARPGVHDGPLRFVYFGQVEPLKGIPQLVAGLHHLRTGTRAASCTLDIIGPASASYASRLANELDAMGLDRHVRLVGRLDKPDLMNRLADYDAAVLPLKLDEPFGYAWLEAAATGLPVVVTRGHAVTDAFPLDYPLFIADRDDPEAVARPLRWLIEHRDALGNVGSSLARHLRSRCDTVTVVNPRYVSILEQAEPPTRRASTDALLASTLTAHSYALAAER